MARSRTARKQRRAGAPLRLYLTFLVGWGVASFLLVRGARGAQDAGGGLTSAWFFVAGTGVLVVALIDRDLASRRGTDRLLRDRQAVIESMGVVTDPKLTQLPLYQLLDELLSRVRSVLHVDSAAVLLADRADGVLRLIASNGEGDMPEEGLTVGLDAGVLGRVASSRRGLIVADAPPGSSVVPGTASLVVAPLVAEGQLIGVVQLGTRQRRQFADDDLRLLQVMADRGAVAIDGARLEREARRATLAAQDAQRRLALLADAGAVLGRGFDRVAEMADALGRAVVPTFVDWFAFHETNDEGQPRLVAWEAGPAVQVGADGGGDWQEAATDALRAGAPTLIWGADLARAPAFRAARQKGLESVVTAPVMVRSLALGVITVGTASGRRSFRASDVVTVQDLAARVAVAIERVLLGAETQRAAVRTARYAAQLQRLTEGAFAINAALAMPELAGVVAEQAARVLGADSAKVDLRNTTDRTSAGVAKHGRTPKGAHRVTSTLTDARGARAGSISVARANPAFSAEEEAILGSLAQMAAVASANTRLYETVQDSETRLRALYDASPVGIVELDHAGAAVRWNRAAEVVFGWAAYEEGFTIPADVPAAARELVAGVLAGQEATARDAVLGETEVELVAVPLRERDRGVRGAVLAVVDVTERKHVAEQLRQAQRMEAMATMAGGIAHDFNNVLMVITGYADLLLHRAVDDDVRDDVVSMRAAAERAADMTKKLLTVSRRQIVQPELVDVGGTLASMEAVLDVMVGSSVTLDVEVSDPHPVLIDPSQFEQLVLNLVMNGRDAMPAGGTLTVRCHRDDADGSWSVLEIGDSGQGMDAATLEHCFEPFFTTKDRAKGTGLGLSTAYGVVTQAGGTISVASEIGSGSTFTVRLPAASKSEAGTAPRARRRLSPLRILVVDDDSEVRAVVADMLELEGHEVAVAADGKAALAAAKAALPDVLVTDVVMPGMRGPELAKRMLKRHPSVRVVLMSSHFDDALETEGAAVESVLLAKPFSPDALLGAVASATAGRVAQGSKR